MDDLCCQFLFLRNLLVGPEFASELNNLRNCYDSTINPQVSLTFSLALIGLHSFIRDTVGIYDETLFDDINPLKSKKPTTMDVRDCIENLTLLNSNTCGLTFGALDTSWNFRGVGSTVSYFKPFSLMIIPSLSC